MIRTLSNKLLLLFSLLLCLGLCACTGGKTPDTPDAENTSGGGIEAPDSPSAEALHIVKDGKTEFQIVYARSASMTVSRASERLAEWFAAADVTVPVIKDGGNANKNVPTDTYEILIGSTNRAESKAVSASDLPECGFLCRVSGRRLVIQATDENLLEVAVSSLFGRYQAALDEGSLTLEKGFSLKVSCSAEREGWLLHGIPDYAGGRLSKNLYDAGYGLYDYSEESEPNSAMQIAYRTDVQEYHAYLNRLEENGYRKIFENSIGENCYAEYRLCNIRLYVYYTASEEATRIVWDRSSTVDPNEFSYSFTGDANAETVFYAYAIWQGTDGLYNNNCGQLEVIKLPDNSLFIIDGAMEGQFDEAEREGFIRFARKITNTPEDEKVRIACWFFTHDHFDHRSGLATVLASPAYASNFSLERMAVNYLNTQLSHVDGSLKKMYQNLNSLYPECKMLKLHTGMKLELAGMQMEVLYTHEDAVQLVTGESQINHVELTNDASTVLKLTANGVSTMILGDLYRLGEEILIRNIPEEHLKVDMIQVAHHTWNFLPHLYDIARAEHAVFTQSEGGSNRTLEIPALWVTRKVQQYAKPENCYFAGETTGLLFKDGTVTVKETFPLNYTSFDVKWIYSYEGYSEEDLKKLKDYANTPPEGWTERAPDNS